MLTDRSWPSIRGLDIEVIGHFRPNVWTPPTYRHRLGVVEKPEEESIHEQI